jgi:hypothetical protein
MTGVDAGGQEFLVVGRLPGRAVQASGRRPAPTAETERLQVGWRPSHELDDLVEALGHPFTDPPSGPSVHEGERGEPGTS